MVAISKPFATAKEEAQSCILSAVLLDKVLADTANMKTISEVHERMANLSGKMKERFKEITGLSYDSI